MAGTSKIFNVLTHPGFTLPVGGLGTALAFDYRMNPNAQTFGVDTIKDLFSGNMDKDRKFNLGFNALLGTLGGSLMGSAAKGFASKAKGASEKALAQLGGGLGTIALAPGKDLILNSLSTPGKINTAAESLTEIGPKIESLVDSAKSTNRTGNILMGVLGAGALGLGGLGIGKYLMSRNEKRDSARIRMKLPGKKGDPETAAEVDIPINMPEFSPALTEGLDRAVRNRTRKNIRANSFKRNPITGKLMPYDEWHMKFGPGSAINKSKTGIITPEVNTPTYADVANQQTTPADTQEEEKAASVSREYAEGGGSMLTTILSALAGGAGGAALGNQLGIHPAIGTIGGSLLGAITPNLLGAAAGSIAGPRDPKDQLAHDSSPAVGEYLIPGYATYQNVRRHSVVNDQNAKDLEAASYMATGATPPNSDYSEDDYDEDEMKMASAPQPPAAKPQGRPIDPKLNHTAQRGEAMQQNNILTPRTIANDAISALGKAIGSNIGDQAPQQPQPQTPNGVTQ